jgi:hypothetical protein
MNEHALDSLLLRGTKTWQKGNCKTTIDLVLASEELASKVVKCSIHTTERGSDKDICHIRFWQVKVRSLTVGDIVLNSGFQVGKKSPLATSDNARLLKSK